MVQILHPIDPLAHKPRTHSIRCSPLTRRRTLPTSRELSFSHFWRQNAIERAAVRKFTSELNSRASPLPKLASSLSLPIILPTVSAPATLASSIPGVVPGISIQVQDTQAEEIPGTPATPIESQEYYPEPESQLKPKSSVFDTNTKSDVLVDLTIAALYRIYIDDYSETACWNADSEDQAQPAAAALQVPSSWPHMRASTEYYEQSPPSICGSALSSASSTPSSGLPTPQSFSPAVVPEIAYSQQAVDSGRFFPNKGCTASPAAAKIGKPVMRVHSAPSQMQRTEAPTLGDKKNLKWFLVELLRRSRSSASVVQLALHYLGQARGPVGNILDRRFKSGVRQSETEGKGKGEDSPLLDPRRLLLASLMLSTKLLHDHAPNNRAWSRVCGLSTHEVGACERALCQALDWNLANMIVGPRDDQPMIV
ncbi:cyclin [Ceratobasidium sp. AG-Ba]|nr:cyclin [Ceratobasidium sp. AG-Ba]